MRSSGFGSSASPGLEHRIDARLDTELSRERVHGALRIASVRNVLAHRSRPSLGEEIEERVRRDGERIAKQGMAVPVDQRDPREIDGPRHVQSLPLSIEHRYGKDVGPRRGVRSRFSVLETCSSLLLIRFWDSVRSLSEESTAQQCWWKTPPSVLTRKSVTG